MTNAQLKLGFTYTDQETNPSNHDNSIVLPQVEATENTKLRRRVLRKIDLRLLPILGCLYTVALIDRANIGVARISGIDIDLELAQGSRASIVLLVFFIGYIIFELPSNIVIKKTGAANWLSAITFSWGLISLCMGFCQSWISLAVCRALLGVLESGLYPGCIYLISSWYKKYEVQKRLAAFFLTAQFIGAFGNIFAYAVSLIGNSGVAGYKGWRWIFIIEGLITCLLGIASWFIIIDFPDSARDTFLSPDEREFAKARLSTDHQIEHQKVTWNVIFSIIRDWKIWAFSFMYMTGAIGVYAFLFFLPSILRKGLGFSTELSFILSAPPALFSVVMAFVLSWYSDKVQMRGPFVVFSGLVAILGLAMTGFLKDAIPRYIGTFLGIWGVNTLVISSLAWQSNNVVGDAQRSVATALQIMISGIGGIYSSLVFRQQDAPNYLPGIIAVMAPCVVTVILAATTTLLLRWQNKQADSGRSINSKAPRFRYTI